jgi:DNA-binding transcriptional regulator PaaX
MTNLKFINIVCCLFIGLLSIYSTTLAQQVMTSDTVDVVVYFENGMMKSPIHITSPTLQTLLNEFGISDKDIRVTYPSFNEADTLRVNAMGQRIISSNLSRYYTLTLRNRNSLSILVDKLSQLPNVVYVEIPENQQQRRLNR